MRHTISIDIRRAAALALLAAIPAFAAAADDRSSGPAGKESRPAAGEAREAWRGAATGGPQSPAREGVVEDLRDGQRQCHQLTGKERAACEARAAATAQTPRGREGANPTGSTQPSGGTGKAAQ